MFLQVGRTPLQALPRNLFEALNMLGTVLFPIVHLVQVLPQSCILLLELIILVLETPTVILQGSDLVIHVVDPILGFVEPPSPIQHLPRVTELFLHAFELVLGLVALLTGQLERCLELNHLGIVLDQHHTLLAQLFLELGVLGHELFVLLVVVLHHRSLRRAEIIIVLPAFIPFLEIQLLVVFRSSRSFCTGFATRSTHCYDCVEERQALERDGACLAYIRWIDMILRDIETCAILYVFHSVCSI